MALADFFYRIGNLFNNRSGATGYLNQYMGKPSPEWLSIDGNEIELYNTIPQLRAVINRRSTMFGNMVIKHYRGGEEVENSTVVERLNNPNVIQSRNEFFAQRDVQRCLYGNVFTNILRPNRTQEFPTAMWNLPGSLIEVERTGKLFKQVRVEDIVKSVNVRSNGTYDKYPFEDIWHSNTPNVDDPFLGVSPLLSLQYPLSNIKEAYKHRNVIMKFKGALGILSNEFREGGGAIPLNPKEQERLQEAYQNTYGLDENKSKILMTQSNTKWQPMSFPTKDLLLFEEVTDNFMTIIDEYGLNRYIFSFGEGTTFTNMMNGIKIAYQDTIIPIAEDDLKALSIFLGMDGEDECLYPVYDHIPALQTDEKESAEKIKMKVESADKLITSGIMTPEQILNDTNLMDGILV